MPISPLIPESMRILRYKQDGQFPVDELDSLLQAFLRQGNPNRVAVMVDDEQVIEALSKLDLEWLDPDTDYQWSGWLVQKRVRRPPKRIIAGTYADWFHWFMSTQRFRTFHAVVLVKPDVAIANQATGGYIDGMVARLLTKERMLVVILGSDPFLLVENDERRTTQVLRSLLYGTRLSKPALAQQSNLAFNRIPEEMIDRLLVKMNLHLTSSDTRYKLDAHNAELLEGAFSEGSFQRKRRFMAEAQVPDNLLEAQIVKDVSSRGWVTAPGETEALWGWLRDLNNQGDSRLRGIYESLEDTSSAQWEAVLAPRTHRVRGLLESLTARGKLQATTWYREVGRPALAYFAPGESPFLDRQCGQCAFYVPAKKRCRLWWLVNKRRPFFDAEWRQRGTAGEFEIHKMKYASKVGPHSSACTRFVGKKRDHQINQVPNRCEICRHNIPKTARSVVTCQNCRTVYVRLKTKPKVRVLTAYEHKFALAYREITGGEAEADLREWRQKQKERLEDKRVMFGFEDDDDEALAEGMSEPAPPEPPRKHSPYSPVLQEGVDRLAKETDIARQFSLAMARSTVNATKRIASFAKISQADVETLLARQKKYLALIEAVDEDELLPYEALVMKQYWACYGLALREALEWFGPRKRARFVSEFVEDPSGRARGYSPVDAAVNYLHQRRLRLAERINEEVGFPGACDGFIHKKKYNSRGIGLLLDMIDPFKFADREELLLVILNRGLTWRDFRIQSDRRGSNFYYPRESALSKLDEIGASADKLAAEYHGRGSTLEQTYRLFAERMLQALTLPEANAPDLFVLGVIEGS